MFYIRNENDEMVPPKSIQVKIDGVWNEVKGVFDNKLLRKQRDLEKTEATLSKSKKGVLSKIIKLEEIGNTIGRTNAEELEYQKYQKIIRIIEIEMTEVSKHSELIKNQIYFNTKIYPGEEYIRLLKDLTNNGAANFKVIRMFPIGKLSERPMVVFNNKETDGTINNIFYRVINLNDTNSEAACLEITNRLGQYGTCTITTPNIIIEELNKIMKTHEELFYEQLNNIEIRHNVVRNAVPTIVGYVNQYPDLNNLLVQNFKSENDVVLGNFLADKQKVSSILSLTQNNIEFSNVGVSITNKNKVAKNLYDTNQTYYHSLNKSNLVDSKEFSEYKFGLQPDQVPILETFNENNTTDLGFEQSDNIGLSCTSDDSIITYDTDITELT